MDVELSSIEGDGFSAEDFPVEALEQIQIPALLRRHQHDDTAAFVRREPAIVEVIAVERNQCPPELTCEAVMLAIAGAAEIVVLDHEQHIPAERLAHEADETGRHVRVNVNARLHSRAIDNRAEFRGESSHGYRNSKCKMQNANTDNTGHGLHFEFC